MTVKLGAFIVNMTILEKGGEQRMTRIEKAQVIRWLRSRRDDYRRIATHPAFAPNAHAFQKVADAFQVAAKDARYQLANGFPELR